MSASLFDVEHLQKLSYERSKNWANLLKDFPRNETNEEISLLQLDGEYGTELDDQNNDDELASMEDGEYDELSIANNVLRNVTNTTGFSFMANNKSVVLPEFNTGVDDENQKLADIFNQTLPIISEHNRQLKETGFDRILNTFDKNKIEEKVGSWLNRHNSLYGGEPSMLQEDSYKSKRNYRNTHRKEDYSNDSDDSLHSGETARYIRSSRAKAIKNASSTSTTTMIKTYRMVKSKREALREKYYCESDDDDETHIKAIRHRRRIAADEFEYDHHEHGRSQRSHKIYTTPSKHLQNRKVLHKHKTFSARDDSSDSDSYFFEKGERVYRKKLVCCNKHYRPSIHSNFPHTHRSAMKMPPGRSNRICYYSHSLSKSTSSSCSSTSFTANEKKQLTKRNKFYNDNRPHRLESECRCCNDRKLCQDYIHVANTSTEEWFVENCCSPKKPSKTLSKLHKPVTANTECLPHPSENVLPQKTLKNCKDHAETNSKPVKQSKTAQEVQLQKPKATKTKKTKKVSSTNPDDTFDTELQMAIEASKKLYEQEQENKAQKSQTKELRETHVTKPLRKLRSKVEMEKDLTKSTEKIPKKPTKKSSTTICRDDQNNGTLATQTKDLRDGNIFAKPQLTNSLATTSKKTENSNFTSTEETFFASTKSHAICNSTAIPNDTQAFSRQFTENVTTKTSQKKARKNVDKRDGKTSVDEIKINRKRKTSTKNSTINDKVDDEIKEKIPKSSEHDEGSLFKQVKKPRKVGNNSIEKTLFSNDSKEYENVTANTSSTKIATSTVTSTTIRSPDTNCTNIQILSKQTNEHFNSSSDENSDCTLVTSTTNIFDIPKPAQGTDQSMQQQKSSTSSLSSSSLTTTQQQQNSSILCRTQNNTLTLNIQNNHTQTPKGILIYAPQNRSLVPGNSFSNDGGHFTISKEYLSSVIGEKPAVKFLKYYIGRRRFNSNSTIYFKPPSTGILDPNVSSSSASDDDLDSLGQYGYLYESFNKTNNDKNA